MTTPIYKSTIGVMIRQAEALVGIMEAGRAHLGDDADAFIHERLVEDMLPFSFQIRAVCHQSMGGIRSMRSGEAGPPPDMKIAFYAELETLLADSITELKSLQINLAFADGRCFCNDPQEIQQGYILPQFECFVLAFF